MSEYSEHDKLSAISDESQAIGEFLEMCGYTLCELDEVSYTRPRFVPVAKSMQQILADYFEIDLSKIETEKRAMLDAIREMSTRRAA